jgi:transposase InsO family protein
VAPRGLVLADDGVLLRDTGKKRLIFVPSHLRRALLVTCHDHKLAGHLGIRRTKQRVARDYVWTGMVKDISANVRGCDVCQRVKSSNQRPAGKMDSEIVDGPGVAVSVDFVGPLVKSPRGHQYALVIQDDFTKFVEIYAVRQATAQCAVECVTDNVCRYGFPRAIRSDNALIFSGKLWSMMCRRLGIRDRKSTPYRPLGNSMVERTNEVIKQTIKVYIEKHSDWDKHPPAISFAMRTSSSVSTGFTPASLTYGRELRDPFVLDVGRREKNESGDRFMERMCTMVGIRGRT